MQLDLITRMQWERAKGELRAFVLACAAQDDDEEASAEIKDSVENMISDVEELMEDE
jgi:KaiC/GvpD/RAD55 family RecA-like ATPase